MLCSCHKDQDITSQDRLEGNYVTSAILDFSCAMISSDKLPKLNVTKSNDDSYDLYLTKYIPKTVKIGYKNVKLIQDSVGYTINIRDF